MKNLNIVAIEVTEGCNLSCSFCARDASNINYENITIDQYQLFLDKVLDITPLPAIAFTGGEPLLHPKIKALIQKTIENNLKFSITTNGTITDDEVVKICKETIFFKHFIVSLDSFNARTHNQIRGHSSAFQRTMKFLKKLNFENIDFCINMTVDKENYLDVYNTIIFSKKLGAKDISIATVKPSGRGESNLSKQELNLVSQQIIESQNLIDEKFSVWASEVTFFLYDMPNYSSFIENGEVGSCSFGSHSLHIKRNGDIQGCATCNLILDNVYSKNFSFENFWNNNEILKKIRIKENLSGYCRECKYVKFCGGCRCRAYALTGDLFGDDLYCPLIEGVTK